MTCYDCSMDWVIILLILVVILNAGLIFFLMRPKEEKREDRSEGLLLIQNQMETLNRTVNNNIKEIIEKVTKVDETGRQMVSFADQLQSLQDILKNPKQRGVLGEYYLETLLKNV